MNGHYASECPMSGKNSKKWYNYDEFTYHSNKNCPNETKSDEKSRHFRKGSILMVFDRIDVILGQEELLEKINRNARFQKLF